MTIRKLITVLCFLVVLPVHAWAQSGMTLIRDTEIEETLKQWTRPIFEAAGLNPAAVDIILVQSPEINAFVAGGSNIFIYTGLITASKNPGELLGVIAHETGHISGGHLIRGREAMEHASYEAILATIIGMGAAVAGGGGDVGSAIMSGGQGMAMSGYLQHSRTQESSADQAGLRFMEAAGYNPTGSLTFLSTLQDQELLPASQQNPYVRTHPLTRDRIETVREAVAKSAYADKTYSAKQKDEFERMRAKLVAFIEPQRVGWLFAEKDSSAAALYAKSIAAYRRSDKTTALSTIERMIKLEPNNPYLYEVKGQMLRDFGGLDEAATAYRKAISLKPDAALIRIDLAQVLVEQAGRGNTALFAEAEKNLDQAVVKENRSPSIHRLYATIYGREGDESRARYHLAEEAALQGRTDEARTLLTGALPGLKPGTKAARQANDLKLYLDTKPMTKAEKKRKTREDNEQYERD